MFDRSMLRVASGGACSKCHWYPDPVLPHSDLLSSAFPTPGTCTATTGSINLLCTSATAHPKRIVLF